MDDRYLALLSDPRILRAALDTQPVMRRDAQGRDYWDRQPSYALDELVSMADTLDSENRVTAYLADRAMDAGLVRGTPEYLTALSFTPVLGTPQGVEDLRLMGQDVVDQTRAGNYGTAAAEAALTAAMVVPSLLGLGPAAKAAKGAVTDIANSPSVRRGVMDFLTDEFGGVGFRAYHGSPHDFDKFDLSKIGTGEGAQAYGHGLYFAENEGIARFYRDALASRGATFRNEPIDYPTGNSPFEKAVSSVLSRINLGDTPDEALQFLSDRYTRGLPFDQSGNGAAVLDALRSLSPSDFNINPGRMYEVRINADPNDFLDWSKPLALQDAKPKAALDEFFDWYMGPQARDEMYAAGITPRDVQEHFDDLSPKQFSFAMRSRGVPGSKYPDAGSRGMPGALGSDPSRNYVVFDDSMIEILRKYGLLAPTAGLGAYALGKPTEAQAAAGGLLEDRR